MDGMSAQYMRAGKMGGGACRVHGGELSLVDELAIFSDATDGLLG